MICSATNRSVPGLAEAHAAACAELLKSNLDSLKSMRYSSGTMIRDTLTRGPNLPRDAKHVLNDQAHEGMQSSSDPKERKGLKEAHFALGPRPSSNSAARPNPLEPAEKSQSRSRVANLPSGERTNSASLDATARQKELVTRLLTRPLYGGIKR